MAIARALFPRPRLLLLDEPTGSLDGTTGVEILATLADLHIDFGLTIPVATHDRVIEATCRRLVRRSEGELISDDEAKP